MLEHLQHVAGQAETLQATATKLKDDACKAPLPTKISQSSLRDGPKEVDSPLLPANSQRRVPILHVPLVLLLTSGLTRVRTRKGGTRALMRLQLLQQWRLVLHRYGAHSPKQQKYQQNTDPRFSYFSEGECNDLS